MFEGYSRKNCAIPSSKFDQDFPNDDACVEQSREQQFPQGITPCAKYQKSHQQRPHRFRLRFRWESPTVPRNKSSAKAAKLMAEEIKLEAWKWARGTTAVGGKMNQDVRLGADFRRQLALRGGVLSQPKGTIQPILRAIQEPGHACSQGIMTGVGARSPMLRRER